MVVKHTLWWGFLGAALGTAAVAAAAEPDPELAQARKTLTEAGISTDGAGLLEFFRSRTLTAAEQERLAQTVRMLGNETFDVREQASADLVRAGRVAVPHLKAVLADPDLEIARRAERCLELIERSRTTGLVLAAVRMLADRKPEGAAEIALGYLPFAEEDSVEEALLVCLGEVGVRQGKPDRSLIVALADRELIRRAAAAHILGRLEREEERQVVRRLLTDSEPRVRYEAAAALASAGERQAVPVLIGLLGDGPLPLAWQAEEVLYRLGAEQAPQINMGTGTAGDRRKSREAWEAWWRAHAEQVDMKRLHQDEPVRGLTLVCLYDGSSGGGSIMELGKDGKARWQFGGLQGPNDVQLLPGGRVLIAERNGGKVSERDRQGNITWQHLCTSPIACQRLGGGNTLIATFNDLFEVSPTNKVLHTHSHRSGFRHAQKLRNGHIIYVASNGEIGELDGDWKPVRTITPASWGNGAGYWASIEPLPGGRFLVVYGGANKVVELDGAGKIVWECTQQSPVFATRLRNGNTLISCFEGRWLIEINREGREVGKQSLEGRPFAARRY
jgi:hypothetical protein